MGWLRENATAIGAAVAVVLSIVNFIWLLAVRKIDWRRSMRVPRYATFVDAANARFVFLQAEFVQKPDTMHDKGQRLQHAFNAALAEVLIVGPRDVARAASVMTEALEHATAHAVATGASPPVEDFERASNEFIEAASRALSLRYRPEDIDFARWKALPPKARSKYPR